MKCKKCGKKMKSNEKFCTYCGTYIDETDSEDNNTWSIGADLLEETIIQEEEKEKEENKFQTIEFTAEDAKRVNPQEEPKEEEKKEEEKEKSPEEKKEPLKEINEDEKVEKRKTDVFEDIEIEEDKLNPDDMISIKDNSGTKKGEYSYENEDLLEAYIGEDYKIIKKMPINIWAFLLNWMYLLYRKLYITGIAGLILSWLVVYFFKDYFLIYLGIIMVVLCFAFNKYYIFIAKQRVERILAKAEGEDRFNIANTCMKKGGVNVLNALIIYTVFLVAIFFTFVVIKINTTHNTKFWEENSENQANCIRIIKIAYNNIESDDKLGTAKEAVCKVLYKKQREYEVYIKTEKDGKKYYSFYKTENGYLKYVNDTSLLNELQVKKANGQITTEETLLLTEVKGTEMNYQNIYTKSKEEKNLIDRKKNKKERINFDFTEEEIIR